jgi:hypothetical protein
MALISPGCAGAPRGVPPYNRSIVRIGRAIALLCLCAVAGTHVLATTGHVDTAESPQRVTGNERIVWNQSLEPGVAVSAYQFAAYVDNARRTLASLTCTDDHHGLATCSASLPPLSPGQHVLQLVTILRGVESPRSDPLLLQMMPLNQPPEDEDVTIGPQGFTRPGADGGEDLEPPTDAALLPDGRIIVTERRGTVAILSGELLASRDALRLDDVDTRYGGGVFAVAVHPQFAANRYVYFAYSARARDGSAVYRVVRTREVAGAFAEHAVVLDGVPTSSPASAALRFGPDGKLYVALAEDAAGAPTRDPYQGAVLRIEDDGSTPRDNERASPVVAQGIGVPRGLAWSPDGDLWVSAFHADGIGRVHRIGGATYTLGHDVVPGGIGVVTHAQGEAAELWIGRSDSPGLYILSLAAVNAVQAQAPLRFDPRARRRIGCIVGSPEGGAYLCAGDNAGRRVSPAGVVWHATAR